MSAFAFSISTFASPMSTYMKISIVKLIFLVQKQISEKRFQILCCFVNAFLQIRIICTDKCIFRYTCKVVYNFLSFIRTYCLILYSKRQIPMTEDVKNAFLLEKEMQELGGIYNNVTVDGYQNFIFINRFGGIQHQGSLNKALRRIIRDCNDKQLLKEKKNPVLLPNFSCHSLRHTFTTRLVEAGVNIKVIQNLCGHSRSDVTLDIYTTVTKELKQAEFDDFQKKLKEKKQEWKNRQEKDA